MHKSLIMTQLKQKGLKVTTQRLAIMESVYHLGNHPTADEVVQEVRLSQPKISVGTVYKVLDSMVKNGLIRKVKSEKEIMRYDALISHHHHLYCADSDQIVDYLDPALDQLIKDYFQKKKLVNFEIEEITLQINGKFFNTNK